MSPGGARPATDWRLAFEMYSIDRSWFGLFRSKTPSSAVAIGPPRLAQAQQLERRRRLLPSVSRTVWALGLTSLLTDVSSEMVASILPAYLVLHLGMNPLAYGFLDGIHQGAAGMARIAGGVLADRWRRHRAIAGFGYALSAACRVLLLFAGSAFGTITTAIFLDRIGKGIRTAPRDALISLHTPPQQLGTAFGVHRAMDAIGAMLGPVVAFVLLASLPGRFDVLLAASFAAAIMGLAAIALLVPSSEAVRCHKADRATSMRTIGLLLDRSRFRRLLIAGTLLGLPTVSDGFVFLILQQLLQFDVNSFPLLYIGTFLLATLLSIPFGRLADRVGRARVLFGGYTALALAYAALLLPAGNGGLILTMVVLSLGAFYAATDGVLMAMAATELPSSHLGSGLALLATASNLARLVASVAYGLLWSRIGLSLATWWFLVMLALALLISWRLLRSPCSHE